MSVELTKINGLLAYQDSQTFETVLPIAPVVWGVDFAETPPAPWQSAARLPLSDAASDAGYEHMLQFASGESVVTIESPVADEPGGVCRLVATIENTLQYSTVTWGNQLRATLTRPLCFETRVSWPTVPTTDFVDGTLVGSGSVAGLDSVTGRVQPYLRVSKTADASEGEMWIDYVKLWQER